MNRKIVDIVWFKRDLSVYDNILLLQASRSKGVLLLYIFEPDLWLQPDLSFRQYQFLTDALSDLKKELIEVGGQLIIKVGSAVEVLNELSARYDIRRLWSHQETWNLWTYKRDKQVSLWTKSRGIEWIQPPRNGVIRNLENRDGWSSQWQTLMNKKVICRPDHIDSFYMISDVIPSARSLKLDETQLPSTQKASRAHAIDSLQSFLDMRGSNYMFEMSSPITAEQACSRISPYLAFGQISVREVYQATEKRRKELITSDNNYSKSLKSFASRLRWHCHFIQKLENQPSIETNTLHSAFENLRMNNCDHKTFTAWATGTTGYPMIDACMRYLNATGWLNFRMRAMLVSFASYHLWLDWRVTAKHLARQFLDYEPGIHYNQIQMQSGTTGMNSIRIYNPVKQGVDQDPNGKFIRKWVPELKDIPNQFIHQPWLLEDVNLNYPKPIVDEKLARTAAQEKIYSLKEQIKNSAETKSLVQKHASRLNRKPRRKLKPSTPVKKQLSLGL